MLIAIASGKHQNVDPIIAENSKKWTWLCSHDAIQSIAQHTAARKTASLR